MRSQKFLDQDQLDRSHLQAGLPRTSRGLSLEGVLTYCVYYKSVVDLGSSPYILRILECTMRLLNIGQWSRILIISQCKI